MLVTEAKWQQQPTNKQKPERERERDRQTDRQTERERQRQRQRDRERQRERELVDDVARMKFCDVVPVYCFSTKLVGHAVAT